MLPKVHVKFEPCRETAHMISNTERTELILTGKNKALVLWLDPGNMTAKHLGSGVSFTGGALRGFTL